MDCAQDEDYVDVFEFMAQQQSAALRPSQFSIDKSSATLSLIEQQRLSASIATPLPPACGTHAEASAGTHEAAAIQAAQSINANFRAGNDARTEMKSISKDPLSMRMDMETEMMELQRGLSHTNRPSESVLFRNPDNSWFGGILGGRVTSTSSSKQLSASPSTRVSANSASDTNPYSTEPLSNYESTLKVMRLLCERACVRTCAGST